MVAAAPGSHAATAGLPQTGRFFLIANSARPASFTQILIHQSREAR